MTTFRDDHWDQRRPDDIDLVTDPLVSDGIVFDDLDAVAPTDRALIEARASAIAASLHRATRRARRGSNGAAPRAGCPTCSGPGRVEGIDLRERIKELRCRACGHAWRSALPV